MFGFGARGNPFRGLAMSTLVCVLAGCTLNPFDDDGAARQTSRALKLTPQEADAPGFVKESRLGELQYVPVGTTPPARTPLKDPKQIEAELAGAQAAAQARAAAPKPRSPYDGRIEPGIRPPPPPPAPDTE